MFFFFICVYYVQREPFLFFQMQNKFEVQTFSILIHV